MSAREFQRACRQIERRSYSAAAYAVVEQALAGVSYEPVRVLAADLAAAAKAAGFETVERDAALEINLPEGRRTFFFDEGPIMWEPFVEVGEQSVRVSWIFPNGSCSLGLPPEMTAALAGGFGLQAVERPLAERLTQLPVPVWVSDGEPEDPEDYPTTLTWSEAKRLWAEFIAHNPFEES